MSSEIFLFYLLHLSSSRVRVRVCVCCISNEIFLFDLYPLYLYALSLFVVCVCVRVWFGRRRFHVYSAKILIITPSAWFLNYKSQYMMKPYNGMPAPPMSMHGGNVPPHMHSMYGGPPNTGSNRNNGNGRNAQQQTHQQRGHNNRKHVGGGEDGGM